MLEAQLYGRLPKSKTRTLSNPPRLRRGGFSPRQRRTGHAELSGAVRFLGFGFALLGFEALFLLFLFFEFFDSLLEFFLFFDDLHVELEDFALDEVNGFGIFLARNLEDDVGFLLGNLEA